LPDFHLVDTGLQRGGKIVEFDAAHRIADAGLPHHQDWVLCDHVGGKRSAICWVDWRGTPLLTTLIGASGYNAASATCRRCG